jgi:aminocarboxymuconate-semialdehyde decarboxylase
MDATGLRRQILSPMPELLSYWLPLEDAQVLLRHVNETIATMVRDAPARFGGLGAVPLQDVDAAIGELEYIMGTLGLAGVEIGTHVNNVPIGAPQFEPFFAAARALGASVFVHAIHPAGRDRLVGKGLEQLVAFPGDVGLAIASMITGGMLDRVKGLRIAFSHGGGAFAMMLPRLENGWKMAPALRDTLPRAPSSYARELWYDTLVYDASTLRHLVATFGADRLCLGSDYPFQIRERDPRGAAIAAGFDADTTWALLEGNARRFLGESD